MIESPPCRRTVEPSFSAATSEAPPRAADLTSTWTSLPGGVVDGSELVLLAIKPSMWRPILESAPWLVMCGLVALIVAWGNRPLPGLSVAMTAQVVMLVAFSRLGVAVVRWVPAWYVLTNRRAIEIRGVRAPRISALLLQHVRNTYLQSSPGEKLARLGTVTFVTDVPDQATQRWQSVSRPEQVHVVIRRAIEQSIDQTGLGR